jgi:high-affinity nickel permease
MQERKHPLSVGFFFSIGHSTILLVASLFVYLTER